LYIPRETADYVLDRCNIQDIVKRYVPSLKQKGQNYLGLCPFHKEKTPSFTVSPSKQIFNCFGCNTGGNVFAFVGKVENLDYPESVKFVADILGIKIEENKDFNKALTLENKKIADALRINDFTKRLYAKYLVSNSGRNAYNYLISRGINKESIDSFEIGYAPDSWEFLSNKLISKKANLNLAEEIGLLSPNQKNTTGKHDKFRNRIIFPIMDINSKTIAFGGRIIDEGNPKYLNSPESVIFKKRNVLYGLNKAYKHIRENKRAIVVEGYLDVIGCHQAGVENVVAPLGTALGEAHIKLLSRYSTEIIYLFDSDSAGINASLKALTIAENVSVDVKVAQLPELDPFDYMQKYGARDFIRLVDCAVKPVDFRINRIFADLPQEKVMEGLLRAFEVVRDLQHESERAICLKKIADIVRVDELSVRKDFAKFLSNKRLKVISNDKTAQSTKDDFKKRTFKDLVALLCSYPHLVQNAVLDYDFNSISDGFLSKLFNIIAEMYKKNEKIEINKLFDFFSDELELDYLNKIFNSNFKVGDPQKAYSEIYLSLKLHEIDEKIEKIVECIKDSKHNDNAYLMELDVLRREKEKILVYQYR